MGQQGRNSRNRAGAVKSNVFEHQPMSFTCLSHVKGITRPQRLVRQRQETDEVVLFRGRPTVANAGGMALPILLERLLVFGEVVTEG